MTHSLSRPADPPSGETAAARPQTEDLLSLSALPEGARVLDLGCGSGTLAYAAFPQLRFFGADQYAHNASEAWPPNAWLVLADAERLPWPEASFDAAICNFVFEHFRDPRAALRELDRVVRSGGSLYLSIPRSSSLQDRLYRFTLKGGGHLHRYSLAGFLQMVYQESGFKLEAMGWAPAGFTWLQEVPVGHQTRRLLCHGARIWQRASGNSPLATSDFHLLFRLGERRGFRHIYQICGRCGNAQFAAPAASNGQWKCPDCAFQNILVES